MRLIRKNPDKNEYRFYEIHIEDDLFDACSLLIRWGRIGRAARQRIIRSGELEDVRTFAMTLADKKKRNGYMEEISSLHV
jgi:predicted DNA-binding WGR domain protein